MKMNKIAFVVISALCVFTFFSCDLLEKPLLEQIGLGDVLQYAPDAENLSSADTVTLANAAGDISIAADPVASKAVLEALSSKGATAVTGNKISNEQKNNILSLTTATVLPIDEIVNVAVGAMSSESSSSNNSSTQDVITRMIDSIQTVDTRATEAILLEKVPSNTAAANITDEELNNVLLATVSVAISACKSAGEDVDIESTEFGNAMTEFMKVFDNDHRNEVNVNTIVNNLGISGNKVDSISNAITIFQRLGNKASAETLMGMFTGGMGND